MRAEEAEPVLNVTDPQTHPFPEKNIIRITDFSVSTYRDSRRGAWSTANDNGVTVTHVPTGYNYSTHADRSQHRNRAVAMEHVMRILKNAGWVE